jgi:4-hydroxy-tetrahydrodipicolinate reductase
MKIALLGYGKMGQEIERIATKRDHEIVVIIDNLDDWEEFGEKLGEADVAIDFSTPSSAVENIYHCFDAGIPIVIGTTGWLDDFDQVKKDCLERNQCMFYAPNYSIGVNLFFRLNRDLAGIMAEWPDYEISIEETHHIHKQDAPSGTAIALANDIITSSERKDKWVRDQVEAPQELGIKSYRTENVPGTHVVKYESDEDIIEIRHTAKSRKGFAMGAMLAAEWVAGRKGFFDIRNILEPQKLK